MSRVFITGGTGFVGTNLCHYLTKETDHTFKASGSNDFDLRDMDESRERIQDFFPDCIVHLAGTVGGIGANQEHPAKFMSDNLSMGMNIVRIASWVKAKLIMVGTVCSYPKFTPVPFEEDYIWNGYPEETNAPYGIAKRTVMELAKTYHYNYGLNVTNLIPANMYGRHDNYNPRTSHVIPALIDRFYKAVENGEDQVEIWGTGKASREFLHVSDFCRAVELSIEKNTGPEPINIGTGQETDIKELVWHIATKIGYSGKVVYDHTKPDGQPRRSLDISRAKQVLGYQPQTTLATGLDETIKMYKREQVRNERRILR